MTASSSNVLLDLLNGYRAVQALYVAAALDIADVLKDGPQRAATVAQATGAHAPSLHRLLRALAALDVVEEHPDGRFALTSTGQQLRQDVPDSLRAAVLFIGGRRHWTAWGGLLDSVRSGRTAFGMAAPNPFSEMAARDPAGARIFHEAMGALSGEVAANLPTAYDFSRLHTLVDVGGGYGTVLCAVLAATPTLRGVVFDLPAVADEARRRIAAAGLSERCEVTTGDAFIAVPPSDAYILKSILHDWSDEKAMTILRNCRAAITEDGALLIVERLVPVRAESAAVATFLSDLNMLLLSGGCERTESEYRAILINSGFTPRCVIPVGAGRSIIEATPA